MARTKPKTTGRVKSRGRAKVAGAAKPRHVVREKVKGAFTKPYDAKKYEGSVSAFASVVAEEMKSWRDDR